MPVRVIEDPVTLIGPAVVTKLLRLTVEPLLIVAPAPPMPVMAPVTSMEPAALPLRLRVLLPPATVPVMRMMSPAPPAVRRSVAPVRVTGPVMLIWPAVSKSAALVARLMAAVFAMSSVPLMSPLALKVTVPA